MLKLVISVLLSLMCVSTCFFFGYLLYGLHKLIVKCEPQEDILILFVSVLLFFSIIVYICL